MNDITRWVVAVAAALLVVALIAWARGTPHHRGIDVGSLGPSSLASSTLGPSPA
jgi:hypothetical protein